MKPVLYLLLFVIIATNPSCTENEVVSGKSNDLPVVEAYLQPGNTITVYLSKMILFSAENADSTQQPVTGKEVYIDHNGVDYLLEPMAEAPGYYANIDSGLVIIPGDEYRLYFNYDENTVFATTTIPHKPTGTGLTPAVLQVNPNAHPGMSQNKVTVFWDNPDNSYHLIITEYLDSLYQPVNPYLDPEVFDDFRIISTRPTLDNAYSLDTRRQLLFFGHYRVIIYNINEEYVNLYENINQSSLNLTEPLTNVNNGLGIFTGINSDTLFLEVQKIWW